MKRASSTHLLPLFGLLGLVGCFLPLVPGFSLFDARQFDGWAVYLVLAAFAIPAALGFADRLTAAGAVVATACFGYVLYKFGGGVLDLVWHGSIGGKALAVAAVGGFASSLGALARR